MNQPKSNAFDLSKKVSAFSSDPKFNGGHEKKKTVKKLQPTKSVFNAPIVSAKNKRAK